MKIRNDKRLINKSFIPTYDVTFPYALGIAENCSLYERKRFKRFISYKQHRAFLARFNLSWRGYIIPAHHCDFMEYRP